MSEEHDSDLAAEIPTEKLEEYDVENPVETVTSVVDNPQRVLLPLLGGGVLLLSALRSLKRGQFRAIPAGAVGAGLLSYGLRNRRSTEATTFEPDTAEIEGGTEGKETSDQASAAAERNDSGRTSQIDTSGDIHESAQLGDEGETGSRIEFTDDAEQDEPRTKPEHVGDEEDPRRNTDDDNDEPVEIDVSDTAMAEEASEATGPDPEQAQPSQTDATEPEETPEEDASDMKVEPDEDADSTDDETNADADEGIEEDAADMKVDPDEDDEDDDR
ncbi:hypothetical protein [Natronorubrum sp. FCH18a]|uniref:hypothetical protein n=1 Tax=Natronorubrum sp. FCH18a TaxID=3447018 RepID=UPI003F50F5F6